VDIEPVRVEGGQERPAPLTDTVGSVSMTKFIQIIEYQTTQIDQIRGLAEQLEQSGSGSAPRVSVTEDRDRPGHYLNIVEFDSYEEAMANSDSPEVSAFAAKMAALCQGPPRFVNLNLVHTSGPEGASPSTKAAVAGAATALAGAAAAGVAKAKQRLQDRRAHEVDRPGPPPTSAPPVRPPVSDDPTTPRRPDYTQSGDDPPPAF
jgi:hypothetical protein